MKTIGKLDNYNNLNKMPILRKNYRIKSIHSSLAIEANSLSLNQVRDIIDGKLVIGPEKEIQEVKNAYAAYEMIKNVNPCSVNDLKKVHGKITNLLVSDSGEFRKGNEGVFDGNGRTARLWQNVILSDWEELFEYVPIEFQIQKYQDDYYIVINDCNNSGSSTLFIDFMLKMIDEILIDLLEATTIQSNHISLYINRLLDVMDPNVNMTAKELIEKLGLKSRVSLEIII